MPSLLTAVRSGPSSLAAAHGTLRERLVRDIAHQARRGSARGADLVHDGLRAQFVDVGDQNCGTVGGEQPRHRPSDPRTSPGDDRGTTPNVVRGHPGPQFFRSPFGAGRITTGDTSAMFEQAFAAMRRDKIIP
jgi:hypothetical protein